jgi:Kef-type K+ transport system membrane component KefB
MTLPALSLAGIFAIAIVAFLAPIAANLVPHLRIPAVVLEITAGVVIGPAGLGWVRVDMPINVLSVFGLAFLLFLAGLEVDLERFRGRLLWKVLQAFALSFVLALAVGLVLGRLALVRSPLFIAIVLAATALGIVTPVLQDAGEADSDFGQLVIAAASVADLGTVILLSLFFSGEAKSIGAKLVLLAEFALLAVVVTAVIVGFGRVPGISKLLRRLQDTTAQIRVRGAFTLLAAFALLAQNLGLEVILGAFTAGAVLRLVDRDQTITHPHFREKLEAVGFGIFIPVFFVVSGMQINLRALFANAETLLLVPAFLVALLLVRGIPALLYTSLIGRQRVLPAAFLQATSLSFIVAASQIGLGLGIVTETTVAALIAAGVLSVLIFPTIALPAMRTAAPSADLSARDMESS